jgi:excisionase family DNA binding protein
VCDGDEILTMDEAAAYLRISRKHLGNILKGRIKGVPPLKYVPAGRRNLIRRSTLRDWVAKYEQHTPTHAAVHDVA